MVKDFTRDNMLTRTSYSIFLGQKTDVHVRTPFFAINLMMCTFSQKKVRVLELRLGVACLWSWMAELLYNSGTPRHHKHLDYFPLCLESNYKKWKRAKRSPHTTFLFSILWMKDWNGYYFPMSYPLWHIFNPFSTIIFGGRPHAIDNNDKDSFYFKWNGYYLFNDCDLKLMYLILI